MVLMAAWMALLHRYTGESDLVIGSPTAGRLSPDLEPLIGFFANTLVLRTDVTGNPQMFVELVQRVRRTALEAYARQEVPFEQIVEVLNPVRDQHRNPVVQVLIGYENASEHPLRLHGLQVDEIGRHTAVVPFQLDVASPAPRLRVSMEGSLSRRSSAAAARAIALRQGAQSRPAS